MRQTEWSEGGAGNPGCWTCGCSVHAASLQGSSDSCSVTSLTEKGNNLNHTLYVCTCSAPCLFRVRLSEDYGIIISLCFGRNIAVTWWSRPFSQIVGWLYSWRLSCGWWEQSCTWTRAWGSFCRYSQGSHDRVSLRVKQAVIWLLLARHMAHWSYNSPPLNFAEQWHPRNYPADQHVILLYKWGIFFSHKFQTLVILKAS